MVCHLLEDDASQEEACHTLYEQGRKCAITSIRFLRKTGQWTRAKHLEWLRYYTRRWRGYQHSFPHRAHWSAGMVTVLKSSYARAYSTDAQPTGAEREREQHFASRSPLLFFDGKAVHICHEQTEERGLANFQPNDHLGTKLVPRSREGSAPTLPISYTCLACVLVYCLCPLAAPFLIANALLSCLFVDLVTDLFDFDHHHLLAERTDDHVNNG